MGIDKADVRTVVHAALPGERGGLLPGDRPRRPRREALARRAAALLHRPAHPRVLPRARLPRALRPRAHLPRRPRGAGAQGGARGRAPRVALGHLRQGAREALDSRRRGGDAGRVTCAAASRAGRPRTRRSASTSTPSSSTMARYAEAHGCRMRAPRGATSATCRTRAPPAACATSARPTSCATLRFGEPSASEVQALGRILEALHERDGQATGRLHRELLRRGAAPPRRSSGSSEAWCAPGSSACPRTPSRRTARASPSSA